MQVARLGFGCCIDNYGDRLYVIGGSVGKHKATDKCEYYDIESDNWVSLPSLSEPRFSHTLCVFNDEWLFAFGGFNKDQNLLTKIERYDISTEKAK